MKKFSKITRLRNFAQVLEIIQVCEKSIQYFFDKIRFAKKDVNKFSIISDSRKYIFTKSSVQVFRNNKFETWNLSKILDNIQKILDIIYFRKVLTKISKYNFWRITRFDVFENNTYAKLLNEIFQVRWQ